MRPPFFVTEVVDPHPWIKDIRLRITEHIYFEYTFTLL
jgi:hypothetical protein